jgi:hypothetical protein
MNKYKNGKIYKIHVDEDVYIGSTIMSLKRRLWHHINCNTSSLDIKDKNCSIELIEKYSCNNNDELRKREQYYIDSIDCLNKRMAYQTKENRKDYKKNNDKKNYELNKEYISLKSKYQRTWGGDKRYNNNLLQIDIGIFN